METRPLYVVLGIPTDATPEEVKRAYHMQALRYHPDKAGPEGAEKFQQVLAAYTLLSDPDAREVYDRYGEQGLSNIEIMPAMAEVTHMMSVVLFFRITFGVLSILCALGFLFVLLVVINVDKNKGWNWVMIAWPAFVAGLVVMMVVLISMTFRIKKYMMWYQKAKNTARTEDSSSASTDNHPCGCRGVGQCGLHFTGCPPETATEGCAEQPCKQACQLNKHLFVHEATFWVRHIAVICLLTTFAMVCDMVQQEITKRRERPYSWFTVFAPCILASFLSIAYIGQFRHALLLRGVHELCSYMLFILNVLSFIMFCCRVAQAIFIPLALERTVNWRPMLIAMPSILMFITRYAKLVCVEIARVHGLNKFADRQRNPNARSGCSVTRISDEGPDVKVHSSAEDENDYGEELAEVDLTGDPNKESTTDKLEGGPEHGGEEVSQQEPQHRYGFTQPSFMIQVGIETVTHVLIVTTIILCAGKAEGWNISMTAALAPALIMFGFLCVVFAVLYTCFSIYVSTVKQEERQKRKAEEREKAAEIRRQRQERRRERREADFGIVPAPVFEQGGIRSHYHGRGGDRQGAFYWGYTADAPPPMFPQHQISAARLAEEADEEYIRTPFTPRNDVDHYGQQVVEAETATFYDHSQAQAAMQAQHQQYLTQQQQIAQTAQVHMHHHQLINNQHEMRANQMENERYTFENGGHMRANNNIHENNAQHQQTEEYVEASFTPSVSPLTPPNRFYSENPRAGFHSRIPIDCPEANEENY